MFKKKERSGFRYWFAHWCAYQMTALNLKAWRWKYLFHDVEKPWMMLWYYKVLRLPRGEAYAKVQKWHRYHNRHHLECNHYHRTPYRVDYEAMAIDWECSRFTKEASPRTAFEEYMELCRHGRFMYSEIERHETELALKKLGLYNKKLMESNDNEKDNSN